MFYINEQENSYQYVNLFGIFSFCRENISEIYLDEIKFMD